MISLNLTADANYFPRELSLISNSEIYTSMNLVKSFSSFPCIKLRLDFNTNTIKWIIKVNSTPLNDQQLTSASLYFASNDTIFSLVNYSSAESVVLFQLNATDGSFKSQPYATDNTLAVNSISGMVVLINNFLYFVVKSVSNNNYLIIFDNSSKSSKIYLFLNSITIYNIGLSFDTSRIILMGSMNSYSYLSKVKSDQFQCDSYIQLSTFQFLQSNQYSSSSTINSTLVKTDGTLTSQSLIQSSLSLSLFKNLNSDISLNCGAISDLTLVTNTTTKILVDLSCSISGNENINYQLTASLDSSLPSWVTLDSANRVLIVNTTNVSSETSSNFLIKSSNSNYQICDKTINLKVVSCSVQNCLNCKSNNPILCQTCNDGYNKSQDSTSCTITQSSLSTVAGLAKTSTQSVVGAVAGATAVFSLCNMSSPQGIWIAMNQFQLILLLLLTNSHIPKSIVDYLSGMKATTCSLNFIPFKDIPGLNTIVDWFRFDQSMDNLSYFGIFSGSSFSNNFSLICVFVIIMMTHLMFYLLFRYLKIKDREMTMWTKVFNKVFQLFTYTIYVRLILESNQFILLSSFSELRIWSSSNNSKTISLIIAFIASLSCISFIVANYIHWRYNCKIDSTDHYMPFKEFFSDLKDKSVPRLYSTIILIRRAIFVIYLIMGNSFNSIGLVVPLVVFQLLYFVNLVIIRPFKAAMDNVLELTNEIFYFVLIVLLVPFNSDSKWNKTAESIYLFLIIANSLCSVLIIASSILTKLQNYSKNKLSS